MSDPNSAADVSHRRPRARWFAAVRWAALATLAASAARAQTLPSPVDACGHPLRVVAAGGRLALEGARGAP